jgi:serine/threonine protein kinase
VSRTVGEGTLPSDRAAYRTVQNPLLSSGANDETTRRLESDIDKVLDQRYRIVQPLGAGGSAQVYLAEDQALGREVAVKILDQEAARDQNLRKRFVKEARALAQLAHPNVVAIHDVGMFEAELFIAMEYIEGLSLRRWLAAEPRALPAVLDVFAQAARGLAAAHDAALVHRDFKPDNVLVGDDGRVRVLDFGLARAPRGEAQAQRLPHS